MSYKDILKIIPTIHSASLVNSNLKDIKKKKKFKTDDTLHSATKNIIGISLIKTESNFIGGLWI